MWSILSYRGEIQQLHNTETSCLNLSLDEPNLSAAGQIIDTNKRFNQFTLKV